MNPSYLKTITQDLSKILATHYTLYLKTQNYHWNVTGMHFQTLHEMFESQYSQMVEVNDEIAERIRALGSTSPGSFAEFLDMTSIAEAKSGIDAKEMVKDLLESHNTIIDIIRETLALAADNGDDATGDLLAPRLNWHEKTVWILTSTLS